MAQTSANPELKLETVKTSDETIVRCIGKLTNRSSEVLRSALFPFPETKRLVLDLKDLTYLDSLGLGTLVSVYLSARSQDCELRIVNVNQQVQQVIRITNLGYLIE